MGSSGDGNKQHLTFFLVQTSQLLASFDRQSILYYVITGQVPVFLKDISQGHESW